MGLLELSNWVALTSLFVLSCGQTRENPNQVPAPPGASGSGGQQSSGGAPGASSQRLVPWQLEVEGSPPLVLGIFDTERELHCQFLPDREGQLRCLPEVVDQATLSGRFADPQCRVQVYEAPISTYEELGSRLASFPLPLVGACEPQRYEVGTIDIVPLSAPVYGGEPCAETYHPSVSGQLLFAVAAVEPQRFVAGAHSDGPRFAERLRLRRFVTESGASFDDRIIDERWSASCQLRQTEDCLPPYLEADSRSFTNEGCTEQVWKVPACEAPTFIAGELDVEGGRELGEPYAGPVWENYGHGGCMPHEAGANGPDQFFFAGPSFTEPHLARFQFQAEGSGKLRVRGVVGDDASTIVLSHGLAPWLRYHDTESGEDCDVLYSPDGVARCVPGVVLTMVPIPNHYLFVDDQCTQPAYQCYDWRDRACEGGLLVLAESDGRGKAHPQSVGALSKLPGAYFSDGTSCTFDPAFAEVYARGSEIPWDTFVALPERHGRNPPGPP